MEKLQSALPGMMAPVAVGAPVRTVWPAKPELVVTRTAVVVAGQILDAGLGARDGADPRGVGHADGGDGVGEVGGLEAEAEDGVVVQREAGVLEGADEFGGSELEVQRDGAGGWSERDSEQQGREGLEEAGTQRHREDLSVTWADGGHWVDAVGAESVQGACPAGRWLVKSRIESGSSAFMSRAGSPLRALCMHTETSGRTENA